MTLYRVLPPDPSPRSTMSSPRSGSHSNGREHSARRHDRRTGTGRAPRARRWWVPDRPQVAHRPRRTGSRRYVVVNGAEGEPGTFKDRIDPASRTRTRSSPARSIAAYDDRRARHLHRASRLPSYTECDAVEQAPCGDGRRATSRRPRRHHRARSRRIPLRRGEGDCSRSSKATNRCRASCRRSNTACSRPHRSSAGTATEAEPGEARGDRANPTLVNNVETLAHVTWILAHGADDVPRGGYRTLAGNHGVHVVRRRRRSPACSSCRSARRCACLIDELRRRHRERPTGEDGVLRRRQRGARRPRASTRPPTSKSLAAAGGGLGSAGFIVYDDGPARSRSRALFSRFLYVESCGQCPPCKLQSGVITESLEQIEHDRTTRSNSRPSSARSRPWPTATAASSRSRSSKSSRVSCARFPEDVVAHEEGRCGLRHDLVAAETRRLRRRRVPLRRETGAEATGLDLYVMCTPRRPDQKGDGRRP